MNERVRKYTYLGTHLTEINDYIAKIKVRIQKTCTNLMKMKNVLGSKDLSSALKILQFKCYVYSTSCSVGLNATSIGNKTVLLFVKFLGWSNFKMLKRISNRSWNNFKIKGEIKFLTSHNARKNTWQEERRKNTNFMIEKFERMIYIQLRRSTVSKIKIVMIIAYHSSGDGIWRKSVEGYHLAEWNRRWCFADDPCH